MTHAGEPGHFDYFASLVPELQKLVLVQAGCTGSKVINLHLTNPNQSSTADMPWKHMILGKITHPPAALLQACRNFRETMKGRYPAIGFDVKYTGWGMYGEDYDEIGQPILYDLLCNHDEDVGLRGNIAWNPDIDVVLFTYKDEPFTCADRSNCNAVGADYVFAIDKKVKYVAVPLKIWVAGSHKAKIIADGMKILFVLIDDMDLAEKVQGWNVRASLGENLASLSDRFTTISENPGRGVVNKVEFCNDCDKDDDDGEDGDGADFEVRAVLTMEDVHLQVEERERSINGVVDGPAQT